MKIFAFSNIKETKQIQFNNSVEGCEITAVGLTYLFNSLHRATSLRHISLSTYNFDDSSILALSELILATESIHCIDGCELSPGESISREGLKLLAEQISGNVSITSLSLAIKVDVSDESFYEIFKTLVTTTGISYIYIPPNSLSQEEKNEINHLLALPIQKRDIPIKSNTKSAAKSSRT